MTATRQPALHAAVTSKLSCSTEATLHVVPPAETMAGRAISNRLAGRWNAAVIESHHQRPELLAEGPMREIGEAITMAAQEGKLVRLRAVIG